MRAPEAGLAGRLAVERALDVVDADAVEGFPAGKDQMLVAGQDDVDAVDLRQVQRRVLLHAAPRSAGDAGMAECDDEVGLGVEQVPHCFSAASTMSVATILPSRLPLSHCMICGGTKPITPILSTCLAPVSSSSSARTGARDRPADSPDAFDIGADHRELGLGEAMVEEFQPVIELVIAERAAG
jgi:hypothetical protein